MTKEILFKVCDNNFYSAEIKDGKITGVNEYYLVEANQMACGNEYIEDVGWSRESQGVEKDMSVSVLNKYKVSEDDKEKFENTYRGSIHYCGECSIGHDMDDYSNSFIITEYGRVLCKGCANIDDLLVEVTSPEDIFKAKDITGVSDLEGFEKVHTIFHDCGWGGPATSQTQAEVIINELLETHGQLYAGLTGVGQFQVYVTLYKVAG